MKNILSVNGPGWDEFYTIKDGTRNVRMVKIGRNLVYQFRYKRKWYELYSINEAPLGGGIMHWSEYKQRTDKM